MPEAGIQNNEINQIITETYASKGQDYLFSGWDERERLLEQHPLNKELERPIDWEVLNTIQFYNQLSCLTGNDGDDGLFRLKEPYRSQMEAEFAEEVHQRRLQGCQGDGSGDPQDRASDGADESEDGGRYASR
jgi:hypothetical protein